MQTFLPGRDYRTSAQILDYQRLGKQRVEGAQLIRAILRKMGLLESSGRGYMNHPALLMWWNNGKPFVPALIDYTDTMIREWQDRGYVNTMDLTPYRAIIDANPDRFMWRNPSFIHEVYESHICRLLQKDFGHYHKETAKWGIAVPADWRTREYNWTPGV